jgi:hypothetical protein
VREIVVPALRGQLGNTDFEAMSTKIYINTIFVHLKKKCVSRTGLQNNFSFIHKILEYRYDFLSFTNESLSFVAYSIISFPALWIPLTASPLI